MPFDRDGQPGMAKVVVEEGSANVYAGVGRPDADEMLVKAQLASRRSVSWGVMFLGRACRAKRGRPGRVGPSRARGAGRPERVKLHGSVLHAMFRGEAQATESLAANGIKSAPNFVRVLVSYHTELRGRAFWP